MAWMLHRFCVPHMKLLLSVVVLITSACSISPTSDNIVQASGVIEIPDACFEFNRVRSSREATYAKWNLVELKALLASPKAPISISDLFEQMNEQGLLGAPRNSNALVGSSQESPSDSRDRTRLTTAALALVYGSESRQRASIDFPRIIGMNAGQDFFFGIEGKPREGEQLEWIQFHCTPGHVNFEFGVVMVDPHSSKLKLLTSDLPVRDLLDTDAGKQSIKSACGTNGCHGKNMLRPNLQAYSLWKKMIGSSEAHTHTIEHNVHASKPLESEALDALIRRTRSNPYEYKRYIPILSHLLMREYTKVVENQQHTSLHHVARAQLSTLSVRVDGSTRMASMDRFGRFVTQALSDTHLFNQIKSTWTSLLSTYDIASEDLTDAARAFILGDGVPNIEKAHPNSFCGQVALAWEAKLESHREGLRELQAAYPLVRDVDIEREIEATRNARVTTKQFCIQAGRFYYLGNVAQDLAQSSGKLTDDQRAQLALDDWFPVKRPLIMGVDQAPLLFEPPHADYPVFRTKGREDYDPQHFFVQLFDDEALCH